MNLKNFDCNSFDVKLQIIRDQGTFLMSRKGRMGRISLYQVNLFFVEVWYDPEYTCVKMVREFECSTFLEPYLENIQILELYARIN